MTNSTQYIDIVFDAAPGHASGRFIEVEDDKGAGIDVGTWHEREDGLWALRLRSEDVVSDMQDGVVAFHQAMGQPVGTQAQPLPEERIAVRAELIREEFEDELLPALLAGDMVETADACIDIMYVTLGLLTEMGINAQPLFDEVQASNMSKLGEDGKGIIAGPNDPDGIFEGRVKKGPRYFRPDLRSILETGAADLGRL